MAQRTGLIVGGIIVILIIIAAAVMLAGRGGQTTTTASPSPTASPTTQAPATTTAAGGGAATTKTQAKGYYVELFPYQPDKQDYGPEVQQLAQKIENLKKKGYNVALVVVMFETDGLNVLNHAKDIPVLRQIRWFSSESIRSKALLEAPEAIKKFLVDVKFTGTFPYSPSTKFADELKKKLEKMGGALHGFVGYAYDAAMLGALAIIKAGKLDGDAIKQALLEISKDYVGVTGLKELDPKTGDLKYQDYSIWHFVCNGNKCEFKDTEIYVSKTGKIIPITEYKGLTPEEIAKHINPDNIKKYIAEWIKNTQLKGEIPIGILLPQTGSLATEGQDMIKAAEIAINDVNKVLEELGAPFKFKPIVQDSGTNPQKALQGAKTLVEQYHVPVIIGTASSAALSGIINYVNAHKVVTISPSSTSPALAKDDYVFRVVGNDMGQGKALAALVKSQGYNAAVVFYRKDAYGEGIAKAFKADFEKQ